MHVLSRLSLILLAGTCFRANAGNFAQQVPEDSFLFVETRDVPGYLKRMEEIPALAALKEIDWQNFVTQLYQIGMENDDLLELDDDALSPEELNKFLQEAANNWKNFISHLNGDVAFSVGNFQDVFTVFSENAKLRDVLALTYGDDDAFLSDDELSPEQLENRVKRSAEEARLDAREMNSILGQFQFWADVKDGPTLETLIEGWLNELIEKEESDLEIQVEKVSENGINLFRIIGEDMEDLPSLNWAIAHDVLVVTLSRAQLLDAVSSIKTPAENTLTNSPKYQDAISFIGQVDHVMYFDFAPLDPLLRKLADAIPESDPTNPLTANIPQADAIFEWLALDAFLPYVIGSKLDQDGIHTRGRYGFSRECALSRIMIDPNQLPTEVPNFVHTDFSQLSSFSWNLGDGWSRLETELMGLAPQAAAAMGLGRMLASGQVGFDLKLQFMDHLNGKSIFVQTFDPQVIEEMMQATEAADPASIMQVQMEHPTGGQNYLIALGMKNEVGIQEAFDRLMTRFHPNGIPEPVSFEGQDIYYPVPETLQAGKFKTLVSYTYLDGYFIIAIGDDQLLKQAVQASQDPSQRITNTPDFKNIRQNLPADASALEYVSAEQHKKTMQILQSSLGMLKTDDMDFEMPDLSPLFDIFSQAMNVSVNKGLVFEIDGLVEFATPEE